MGNSEVGHLNLGAGSIVPQDLARIDAAVRGRDAGGERGAARGARRRRARPPDRAGVGRRRALVRGAPQGADRARRRAQRAGPRDPRLHRRPRHVADLGRGVASRRSRRPAASRAPAGSASVIGRYFAMDRDQRWDRTEQAVDLLCEGDRAAPRRHRRAGGEGRLRARRDRRVHHRHDGRGRRRGSGPATPSSPSTSGPTGCARSRRSSARSSTHYTTLTQYDEDWTFPVAFPPQAAGDHHRRRSSRTRAARSSTSPRPRSTRT